MNNLMTVATFDSQSPALLVMRALETARIDVALVDGNENADGKVRLQVADSDAVEAIEVIQRFQCAAAGPDVPIDPETQNN